MKMFVKNQDYRTGAWLGYNYHDLYYIGGIIRANAKFKRSNSKKGWSVFFTILKIIKSFNSTLKEILSIYELIYKSRLMLIII